MQLTPRADKIIRILLRFSPDSPVTIGIISEELGVSDRSVQRELPTVEKFSQVFAVFEYGVFFQIRLCAYAFYPVRHSECR